MSEEFDPYREWLGFDNKTASTTYYKLLGLREFESDQNLIATAADKAIRKLRSQRPGPHSAAWSKILDELQDIKACLLDDRKKAAYDEDLRFADEFVKELEGGVVRDPAPAAVTSSSRKSAAPPVKQDPRYPPGMAPRGSTPLSTNTREEVELKTSPPSKPIDRKDSPFYPPMRQTDKAKPPASEASPAPDTASASPGDAPVSGNSPPSAATAGPAPMVSGFVQQSTFYPQPGAYPQQPAHYPPPAGYPQGYYPPQVQMLQPGYPYGGPPMAQPIGYGAPSPGPYGISPPAAPMYGAPMAMPLAPQAYMPQPVSPAPAALDPMAPVAIPGMSPATAAIPVGTAVAAPSALPPDSPPEGLLHSVDNPAMEVRGKSAAGVMLAAQKEKRSQRAMLFVGFGGLMLILVALLAYVAVTGKLGGTPVASNQPEKAATANVPQVTPISPEPVKPVTPPVPEPQPAPPAPKPPETKPEPNPEPKPEPVKPEPAKPEPPKPEPPKPEPPKPELKPDPPLAEMPTRDEAVQLGKALQQAKAAIGEFNFEEADAELAKADKLAKIPEHRDKLARLKEIGGYVKQFHERLVQAATGMDGGESFKVGSSTMVAMIEADQKQVILRVAGQNKAYQYADLPVGLAAALADMKLDKADPVARVLKGAFVAAHKNSTPDQLQQAKSWWEGATLGGADVSHLMPFLTDSYDLAKDLDKLKKDGAAPDASKSKAGTPATKDPKAILEGKT